MTSLQPVAGAVVQTSAGGSISAGIWTLVGIVTATAGTVLVAIIKQWGSWQKEASDIRNADFSRLRADIIDLKASEAETKARLTAAEKIATEANAHAMRSDAKLQTALTACELLLGLVEREMPNAAEIGLVKRLLAQAASSDMGISDGLRKLATVRGVDE